MIARFKKNSYQWSPLAVVLTVLLACISLPDAKHTRASEAPASKPAQQPNFRKIRIPTKPGNGVLSPDGKRLAFVSKRSIWVVPVHGRVSPDIAGEPVRLTGTEKAWHWCTSWSADGAWIAYGNPDEICIVPSSGGKVKKIPVEVRGGSNVFDWRLSLSRDGRTVAYGSEVKDNMQIFTADVESGDFKQLTEDGGKQPCFSPDGKEIAYVKTKPQKTESPKRDVWVISAAGGTPVQVSDLPGRATGPVWSPDGKRIAFTRRGEDGENKEICIVPVSETGNPEASPTQIELPLETWRHLAGWTPDNEIGVLLSNPEHQAIYTVPASGGNATQVTPEGYAFHPRWSPDGERIYFRWNGGNIASVPSEGGEISTVPLDADSKIFVALPGAGNAVSPDGKKITFSGAKEVLEGEKRRYEVDIYTIPIEGGEPKKLTKSPGQDRFPCWSPDGKSIAFIRYAPMNICIVPAEGGEVRQLTSESHRVLWSTIAWSPDGKLMAYFSGKNINVIPTEGGEPRVVVKVADVSAHSELAWSPDGSKLVYSTKGSIWVVSVDGGEPEEIKTGLNAKVTHLSWSPDGKKLAFTAITDGEKDFYLMENFLPETPVKVSEPMHTPTLRQIEVRGRGTRHSSPSFDGKYMSDVDRDTGNLVIRNIATGEQRNLTKKDSSSGDFAYWSAISPDSTSIIYYWFNAEKEDFDLRVVGLDGSGDRLLWGAREGARSFNMDAWSPDGKYVYGEHLGKDEPIRLVRVALADGSRQVIKTFDEKRFFTVSSSPDGRYIAHDCAENKSSSRDIFIYDLKEKTEEPLIRHAANDKLLGWTPNGQHIFFTSDRNGTWDGWLQRVVDGKPNGLPEMIKAGMGNVSPIGFTCSGSFYYTFEHKGWNVYTAILDSNKGEVLSDPNPVRGIGNDGCPDWSPDGRYLAYCSQLNKDKAQIIRIRTLATGQERELKTDLPYFDWLRWCPDSRYLLITNFNTQSVVHMIDIQTGEYTSLVKSDRQKIRQAELSADGKTLVYRIRGRGTENWLIIRDLETGREKELLRTEGAAMLSPFIRSWALSEDGKHIAYSIREEANSPFVLKIMSIADRQIRTIVGNDIVMEVAWINDDRDLLFVKNLSELCRVSVEGGVPQKLWKWKEMIVGPRLHPDGQRLAFHSGGYASEMWVMENFLPTTVASAAK